MDDDIIKNIRLIERLKCALLLMVAHLYNALYDGPEKTIQEALINLIVYSYLLAGRLGISLPQLEQGINEKVRSFLQEKDESEHGIPQEELLKFLRHREGQKDP